MSHPAYTCPGFKSGGLCVLCGDARSWHRTELALAPGPQPARHTADTITDNALDQLYARIETLEHVAKSNKEAYKLIVLDARAAEQRAEQAERTIERMKRTNRMVNGCARDARLRAEQAEAAIARVRALADEWARIGRDPNACIDMGDAADAILAALDEPKEPRP